LTLTARLTESLVLLKRRLQTLSRNAGEGNSTADKHTQAVIPSYLACQEVYLAVITLAAVILWLR
jgi:hypothetical protein